MPGAEHVADAGVVLDSEVRYDLRMLSANVVASVPGSGDLLRLLVVVVALIALVGIAVGVVERREDAHLAGRKPAWRHVVMGHRRPARLRIQLLILAVIVGVILVIVIAGCGTAPVLDPR